MSYTATEYSDKVYLQRLLAEGVRDGEYIIESKSVQQYRQNDDEGNIGMASRSVEFCTPEGVVIEDGSLLWNTLDPQELYMKFKVEDVERLTTCRFAQR